MKPNIFSQQHSLFRREGFTLAELLVAITVISILVGLTAPALSNAKEKARRIKCLSNVRQLGIASQMYAGDDSEGSFSAKQSAGDQNLNWLLPYAGSREVFRCPSYGNIVRDHVAVSSETGETGLADLMYFSDGRGRGGLGYHGLGFTGVRVPYRQEIRVKGGKKTISGIRKSEFNVQTYRKWHDAFGLKGQVPGPSRMWIMIDYTLSGNRYYPDPSDGHRGDGANVALCDGSARWISRDDFVLNYEFSQDENRTGIEMPWD